MLEIQLTLLLSRLYRHSLSFDRAHQWRVWAEEIGDSDMPGLPTTVRELRRSDTAAEAMYVLKLQISNYIEAGIFLCKVACNY